MMFSEIIYLNVGGVKYTTSRSTLTKYTDSMLGSMFSQNIPTKVDKDGCYFIDRNGKIFEYILQFLRSGELILPENFENLRLLKCEAEFFQVVPLLNSLKIQEKCLQIHEEKLKNTKNQKIKLICLTTVMVDSSGDATEFDEYVLTRFVCQKVNSNVFEIIHKEVQEHQEIAPLPMEDLKDIDSKKVFSYMIDDTWKLDEEEEFAETYELLAFLVSTGFDKSSFNTLLSCGEQLFWNEINWVQNIQILIYVKNDT